MKQIQIDVPVEKIRDFCRKRKVKEFSLFGSVLRDDFGPDSDVDVLVSFAEDARWGVWDMVRMEDELAAILGREVDLVTRRGIESSLNYLRREAILASAETVHVARQGKSA